MYEDIKNKLNTAEYNFLKTNPHLGWNIILLGLGGSYAYGTNREGSDIDIRGIYLNSREEILSGGIGEQIAEQVTDTATDTVIYSFQKIIQLLCSCNPNTIEMLGLNKSQYFHLSKEGRYLVENARMFLSKKAVHSFGGYANAQLYRLTQKSAHALSQEGLERHILKSIRLMEEEFHKKYSPFSEDSIKLYIDKSDPEMMDSEIFMDVNLHHYPLRDYCSMWNEMKATVSSYTRLGKRNQKALEHNKIGKHMMHLVRLYLMCFDILENEKIVTKRTKEHDFLMEIRNGKYITENNDVLPEFFELVNEYEKRLEYAAKNTSLPEEPDYKKIREFVGDINKEIILGKTEREALSITIPDQDSIEME